jgi:hypothetical protein
MSGIELCVIVRVLFYYEFVVFELENSYTTIFNKKQIDVV